MSIALNKAKDLAKKTNATVMVVNETTDEVFVVMTIDQYERLVNQEATLRQSSGQGIKNQGVKTTVNNSVTVESSENSAPAVRTQEPSLAALTEQELLARMSEQVKEWRSAQVSREQLVLAEMPAEIKVAGAQNKDSGKYNLSGKVDFRVDNLEDEERFFLDDLA